MSLSDRRSDRRHVLGLLAALPLAACGFTPAYGPGGGARALTGKVAIANPSDRDGFELVGRLQERLGRSKSPAWTLTYSITTESVGAGITAANVTTRYNVLGTVSYALTDQAGGNTVTSGSVQNFTSYSASGTVVSTAASERDARTRLMRILADQVVTNLVATAGSWAPP